MARIRTIQPGFPKSPSMGRVSFHARLLFIQLWLVADDAGRLRADLHELARQLYPQDGDVAMALLAWLDELESEGCIERYGSDGSDYLRIVRWHEYQKVDRPTASRLPLSPSEQAAREARAASRASRLARAQHDNALNAQEDSDSAEMTREEMEKIEAEEVTAESMMRDLKRIRFKAEKRGLYSAAIRSMDFMGRRLGLWGARKGKDRAVGTARFAHVDELLPPEPGEIARR
jgi:hypothetical protein